MPATAMLLAWVAAIFVATPCDLIGCMPGLCDESEHTAYMLATMGTETAEMAVETPLNWNLTKADLDGKCLILGDSQSTISSIRFASQLPLLAGEFSRTIMGHHIPGKAMNSVGNQVTSKTVAGVTHTELVPGDAWSSGGDTTVHWNESRDIASTVNLANFEDLLDCMADASDFDAFDLSGPMCFRAAFHNHPDSQLRVSLKEKRTTTEGNNANFGNGGSGTNYAGDVDWTENGDLVVCHKGIRGATAMTGGSDEVGVIIETSGSDETNRQLRYLGGLLHKTGGTDAVPDLTMPSTGTLFAWIARSGWSAYDLINSLADKALDAMIIAAEGFDTVIIPLGQNTEDVGDHDDNMETLANRVITRHTTLGYDAPKIILVSMWTYDANQARMESQADAVFAKANANDWGFVNFYLTYNGDDLATNGARFDGTPATYTMDASNLHPSDTSTAQNIARDFYEHFEDGNRVTTLTIVGGARSRSRGRSRGEMALRD